jgi:hypothetical protein
LFTLAKDGGIALRAEKIAEPENGTRPESPNGGKIGNFPALFAAKNYLSTCWGVHE